MTGLSQLTPATKGGPRLGNTQDIPSPEAPPIITAQQSQTPLHLGWICRTAYIKLLFLEFTYECCQQRQFCCQDDFYLEQTEVLFQESPRLLRHAARWHRTTQNTGCCSAHPDSHYLEPFSYSQEETGSAKQTFQKNPVFTAGGSSLINIFNAVVKSE